MLSRRLLNRPAISDQNQLCRMLDLKQKTTAQLLFRNPFDLDKIPCNWTEYLSQHRSCSLVVC